MSSASRLVLIDGHSQIYRACLTQGPDLTSPDGEPTKGTYYFLRMLVKMVRQMRPDYLLMAIDPPRHTLERRSRFPNYKQGRGTPEPELLLQIDRIYEMVELLDVPLVRVKHWEADDVIASYVDRFEDEVDEIIIITRDKDFHQLVGPRVTLWDPMTNEETNEDDVIAKWGVGPERVVQAQMLVGDGVDGIPGVVGIGPVKARQLLDTYSTVAELYGCREEQTPSVRRALEASNLGLLSFLVTLRRDLPIALHLRDLRFDGLDMARARGLFRELGFRRFVTT